MHDRRIDSFQNTLQPMPMIDYNVITKNSPYRIRLREVPQAPGSNPSTMRVRFFTFLLTAINATTTTIQLDFKESQPFKIGDVIQVDVEKMLITDISGESVIVIRGYDSTIATSHTAESGANPTLAYGHDLEEVSSSPQPGQYWPDYATTPQDIKDWNTGSVMFNASDALKFMEISYMGTGCLNSAERSGNDPLRNYGYDPETDIIAVLSGTVNLPIYNECQIFYVREGATANRAAFPGIAVRATGAAVVRGAMNADYIVGVGVNGYGGGGGGNGYGNSVTYSLLNGVRFVGRATPSLDQQNLFLNDSCLPLFWGSGGTPGSGGNTNGAGGAGGGGVLISAPYCDCEGVFYARGANGGGTSGQNGYGGGGGAGGVIIIVGETVVNTAQFQVGGGNGGQGSTSIGSPPSGTAGPAGWVRVIEYGGRN